MSACRCSILLIAVRTSRAAVASAWKPGVSARRQKPCMFHSGLRPMSSPAMPKIWPSMISAPMLSASFKASGSEAAQ